MSQPNTSSGSKQTPQSQSKSPSSTTRYWGIFDLQTASNSVLLKTALPKPVAKALRGAPHLVSVADPHVTLAFVAKKGDAASMDGVYASLEGRPCRAVVDGFACSADALVLSVASVQVSDGGDPAVEPNHGSGAAFRDLQHFQTVRLHVTLALAPGVAARYSVLAFDAPGRGGQVTFPRGKEIELAGVLRRFV